MMSINKRFHFLCLIFFLCTICMSVRAQQKVHLATDIWPEIQVEYVLKSTSFFYFRNQYRFNTDPDFNGLGETFPGEQLKRFQLRAGYEHTLTDKWSIGGSEMYGIEPNRKLLFTDIYVRHLNSVAGLQITERIMFDYLYYSNSPIKVGRFRPRLDLDKVIRLNAWTIRPRVGYELFMNTDFKPDTHTSGRRVDRTRLRLEVSFQPNPHVAIAPYFTKQTDYLRTSDKIDDQTHLVTKGIDQNIILPIWGLDVRYTFFQGKKPFPRQPAPVRAN